MWEGKKTNITTLLYFSRDNYLDLIVWYLNFTLSISGTLRTILPTQFSASLSHRMTWLHRFTTRASLTFPLSSLTLNCIMMIMTQTLAKFLKRTVYRIHKKSEVLHSYFVLLIRSDLFFPVIRWKL